MIYKKSQVPSVMILWDSVLGVIDTRRSCALPVLESILEDGGRLSIPGTLFEGLPIGIATCVLSLTTNILATLLVAYKGWYVGQIRIGSRCQWG